MTIARIASIPGTTQYKFAGGAANQYSESNLAPAVAAPYNGWAQIISDTPDVVGDTGPAQYLWYQPSVDPDKIISGEIAYFYRRVIIWCNDFRAIPTKKGVHISVCSDNAFLGKISLTGDFVDRDVTKDIYGGPLVLSQSSRETSPFNWQKVYKTDIELASIEVWDSYRIIVEFELKVMNYKASAPGNIFNPSGFIYNIEIDGFSANEGTVTLQNLNNDNPRLPLD